MAKYLFGRNSVLEYLKAGGEADKLYVQAGDRKGSIFKIISMAKDRDIVIVEVDRERLDSMSQHGNHQGVCLLAQDYEYSTVEEILRSAKDAGHAPFLVLLDEITDPHNLGAIIRTAECCGVDGILLPRRRSATVSATVDKTSSGALSYVKIAKINNVNQTIDELKKENIWVYGAAAEVKQDLWHTDFSGGVCLVIGNEGEGLHRLTREKCDVLVSIPMEGHLDSLNASASASILMYEVLRGRTRKK